MPQPDQTDADPFADMRTMEPDEAASSSDEHTLEPDFLSDEDLTSMLKEPEEEPAVPDLTSMLKEPEEEPAIPDFSGFDDEPATAAMDSGNAGTGEIYGSTEGHGRAGRYFRGYFR